jgi:hypothetical protein
MNKISIDSAILMIAFLEVFFSVPFPATCAADSLRCGNDVVQTGDSELTLIKVCGQPTLKKTETVPYRVGGKVLYKDIERWHYNRGRNDFIYIMTIEGGKIVSIETGERGY